jgi:hypothetical protein
MLSAELIYGKDMALDGHAKTSIEWLCGNVGPELVRVTYDDVWDLMYTGQLLMSLDAEYLENTLRDSMRSVVDGIDKRVRPSTGVAFRHEPRSEWWGPAFVAQALKFYAKRNDVRRVELLQESALESLESTRRETELPVDWHNSQVLEALKLTQLTSEQVEPCHRSINSLKDSFRANGFIGDYKIARIARFVIALSRWEEGEDQASWIAISLLREELSSERKLVDDYDRALTLVAILEWMRSRGKPFKADLQDFENGGKRPNGNGGSTPRVYDGPVK